jgi:excisionase family DNA binding protein
MSAAEPLSLSPQGASEYLSLSKPTLYRLLAAGTIKGKRSGTRTMIDGASVRAYYKSLPDFVSGTPAPNAPRLQRPTKHRRKAVQS